MGKSGNLASWFLEFLHGNLTFHVLDLTVKTLFRALSSCMPPVTKTRLLLRLLNWQNNLLKVQQGFLQGP